MTDAAPFRSGPMVVEPDWIDYNGHLNMAYYSVLFDRGGDQAHAVLGLGPEYAESSGHTTYAAEFHICYLRELHQGDEVTVTFHLLEHDEKRFRSWQEMWHSDGWLAATGETLSLHVDRSGPRVAPYPPEVSTKLATMQAAHDALPRPERAGRGIALKRS